MDQLNQPLQITNYIHNKSGVEYRAIREFQFQINGEWVTSVFYSSTTNDIEFFGRTKEDFLSSFSVKEKEPSETPKYNLKRIKQPAISSIKNIQCDDCNSPLSTIAEARSGLCNNCFSKHYRGSEPENIG